MHKNKQNYFYRTFLIIVALIVNAFFFYKFVVVKNSQLDIVKASVSTEERDEEDEKDEEDYEDRSTSTTNTATPSSSTTTTSKPKEIKTVKAVAVPVITYVWVTDPGYDRDTDGDGLVDAIDPDPTIDQAKFFTDTDGDSVPDAWDLYPDQDDLLYTEDTDANHNGILDSFE